MIYGAWVTLGIMLAFVASRLQRPDRKDLSLRQSRSLLLSASIGAVAGAYLLEMPADLMHWAWAPPGIPRDVLPLGGRTVLGGMIGGWLAVEVVKWRQGISGATGDRFALPLALALTCGRLGCASAGCCAGQAWSGRWAWDGCYPVQLIEAAFHGLAAIILVFAAWRGYLRGKRLAIYICCYAIVRFVLETYRCNPPILWSLTYYQFLAIILLGIAGTTLAWRLRSGPVVAA